MRVDNESPTHRAFLAIPLPPDLLKEIGRLQEALKEELPGVRWSPTESMHLTLKFFGDTPEETLDEIGEVMLTVALSKKPFEVDLTGLGAFPSPSRPRVIWLGIGEAEPISELHDALDLALEEIGVPREDRRFSAHLTLGRVKGHLKGFRETMEKYGGGTFSPLPVEEIVLFESLLRHGGAVHSRLKTVRLGPTPQKT